MSILQMLPRTFNAKMFKVQWENKCFTIAGTLDGFIDLATPNGTFPIDLQEAKNLIIALKDCIHDVEKNCLYEDDSLLKIKV